MRDQLTRQQRRGLQRLALRHPAWRQTLSRLELDDPIVAGLLEAYETANCDLCPKAADAGQSTDTYGQLWLIAEIEDEIGLWLESIEEAPSSPALSVPAREQANPDPPPRGLAG